MRSGACIWDVSAENGPRKCRMNRGCQLNLPKSSVIFGFPPTKYMLRGITYDILVEHLISYKRRERDVRYELDLLSSSSSKLNHESLH